MAYTNTGGTITETGYQLGIFIVKAHYTFRGRRSVPLAIITRVFAMDEATRTRFE